MLVYVVWKVASGRPVAALGVYSGQAPTHYSVWGVAKWIVYAVGSLALTTALVPLAAFLLLLMLPPRGPRERAFLATGGAAILSLVVLAGFAAFWTPAGLKDRYLFHVVPVLFLALALWIERGLPRPVVRAWIAVGVPIVLVAILPLGTLLADPALLGNGLGFVAFHRVAGAFGGTGQLKLWLVLGGVVLALVFVLAPRPFAPAALVLPLAALLLVSSVSLFHAMRAQARGVQAVAALGSHPQWIDSAIGGSSRAAYINATQYAPEETRGDWWPLWVPVWESELFNRSLDSSISLGLRRAAARAISRAPSSTGPAGRITPDPELKYVVTDPRLAVAGGRLRYSPSLVLWKVSSPLRLDSIEEGVYRDGWSGTRAAFDGWAPGAGAVDVTVSRAGAPGARVAVTSGPLAPQGGGAQLGGETEQQVVDVPAGGRKVVHISVPKAPYRVEVSVPGTFPGSGGRELGAQVSFEPVVS